MRQALKAAVASRGYVDFSRRTGNSAYFEDAPEYREWLNAEFTRWGNVIRTAKIKRE
ncbi:hypothetical protein HK414_22275 [Ramlibacter terrae]|uniref:Uncharacterized protein n=1 Tax=Ramlibacter terrae TaxID=2732511 RepID=A0ABX6P7T2_9BURK|nr:hypothetical protein HK414_22275 [Ramlibacter terrae]